MLPLTHATGNTQMSFAVPMLKLGTCPLAFPPMVNKVKFFDPLPLPTPHHPGSGLDKPSCI